jgi:hypothetical protein
MRRASNSKTKSGEIEGIGRWTIVVGGATAAIRLLNCAANLHTT